MSTSDQKILRCPQCGYPYYCGCDACRPRRQRGELPMIPRPDIDGNQCPICGFAQSMDGWLEIAGQQHLMDVGA
jgi:hypothetical protein